MTASEVLDLADTEPGARALRLRRRRPRADPGLGRRRAGSTGASTPPTERRTSSTGSRPAPGRRACSRLLLGVALARADSGCTRGVLPVDDVDSGAIELAGRFAECIDRLGAALDALRGPQTVARLGDGARRARPTR